MPFIRDGLIKNQMKKEKSSSAKPLENIKILEIGCGAGILTEVQNIQTFLLYLYYIMSQIHFSFF